MRTKVLFLLGVGAINSLTIQHVLAEQPTINFNNLQPPIMVGEQVPIAWGDCIPVPVMPAPMPMPFSMGNMPSAPNFIPFSGSYGAPNQPQMLLPPPSPFFNPAELPIPLPVTSVPSGQVSCDSGDTIKLNKLQTHYDRAAAASKTRISELYQALEDIQNQMADSRGIINSLEEKLSVISLSKNGISQGDNQILEEIIKLRDTEIVELVSMLSEAEESQGLLQEKYKSLQAKLVTIESYSSGQSRKITTLGKFVTRFSALQNTYTQQNEEFSKLTDKYKVLKENLSTLNSYSSGQSKKITTLGKFVTDFSVLEEAYKKQNDDFSVLSNEYSMLKANLDTLGSYSANQSRKLTSLGKYATNFSVLQDSYKKQSEELTKQNAENNVLQGSLAILKSYSADQSRKITFVGKYATNFSVLQDKYKALNGENDELKGKLVQIDGSYKSIEAKVKGLKSNIAEQAKKLGALDKTEAEIVVLKTAYKSKLNKIEGLKKQLAEMDGSYKVLQSKSVRMESNVVSQKRKLTALGETEAELVALKSAHRAKLNKIEALKKQLIEMEGSYKALKNKMVVVEYSAAKQLAKIATLGKSSAELASLRSTHKDKLNDIEGLRKQLAEMDGSYKVLQSRFVRMESNVVNQTKKLTALGESETELVALKNAYRSKLNRLEVLKRQLSEKDGSYKALQGKLVGVESNIAAQAKKLTALGQSETDLVALRNAYKAKLGDIEGLKKQLAEKDGSYKTLQGKLVGVESNIAMQARKLAALGQSEKELVALKGAYKAKLSDIEGLKKQLAEKDGSYKTLQGKLVGVESNIAAQAKKLTALGQSETDLVALRNAYKAKLSDIEGLKRQLAEKEGSYKALQGKLVGVESNIATQAKKLTALGQSETDLVALRSAYKAKLSDIEGLKKQLTEMGGSNKTLKSKLLNVESNVAAQTRKLTALGQSEKELVALKSAYKAKLNKIEELKKQLAKMNGSYKMLQGRFVGVESNVAAQAKKLTALGESETNLVALRTAYKSKLSDIEKLKKQLLEMDSSNKTLKGSNKARNDENASLKGKMAEQIQSCNKNTKACKLEIVKLEKRLGSANSDSKSLLAKMAMIKKTSSDQASEITSLMTTTGELSALKSSYKDLEAKYANAIADSDKDRVLNQADKCPGTPAGMEVNLLGCFADTDKDGIANSLDKCPRSPENSKVNTIGCPAMKDSDNDGIADNNDLCPTTKTGEKVNNFGCTPTENITLKGVNFSTGSARLTTGSFPVLDNAAKTLVDNPLINVEISGYTDNQGNAAANKRLSQRRANSVMIYLIKQGVDAKNLAAKGYGINNPIASNATNEGRATNRRVEIKIK